MLDLLSTSPELKGEAIFCRLPLSNLPAMVAVSCDTGENCSGFAPQIARHASRLVSIHAF
jgi:hypothetical protein